MIAVMCFTIFVLLLISSLRSGSDFFSPARVFGLTWSFALGLTELKLSAFQYEWSATSWLLILLGPAGFLLGVFVVYVVHINDRLYPISSIRSIIRSQIVDGDRLLIVLYVGFALYFFSYGVSYLVKGFIPLFSPKGVTTRGEFGVFGLGVLVHSVPFVLFFSVLYHIKVDGHKREKFFIKILCGLMAITFLLLLQRFQFIMSFVICVCLLYYTTRKIRLKAIVIACVLIPVLFYFVSTLRAGELLQMYLYKTSRMKYGTEFMIFTEPYMYFVMNFENLARAVELADSYTFGYYTFDFLLALGGVKHWIQDYFALDPSPFLVSTYNTYTALWTFYRDYGVFGIAGIPFALGFIASRMYYWMRAQPSIPKIAAYSIIVFVAFITFFNSPLGFLWFAYNIVAFVVILRIIQPVETQVELSPQRSLA